MLFRIFFLLNDFANFYYTLKEVAMSECTCCSQRLDTLEKYPEKTKALNDFIDSLPLSADIKNNRGFLINCLHKAQGIFGYLPDEVQTLIADKLRLNLSDVYGVISFYSFFTTQPRGKYLIKVCMGTACYVRGGRDILQQLKKSLNIEVGETSDDLLFTLEVGRCFGACGLAPVVLINDDVHQRVKASKIPAILQQYRDRR